MSDESKEMNRKKAKIYFIYIINSIFLPPAKVMFIFWTICCIYLFLATDIHTIGQKIIIGIAGYVIYCTIADIIYISKKERYLIYKEKITTKKNIDLRMLIRQYYPERYQRDYASQQSNIIQDITVPIIQNNSAPIYDNMEGHQFEYFCADILKKNGFENVEVTQGSGDHGIDILAEKDSITYAIQCKCYSSNIGNSAVQQAHTGKSLYHKDIAVVLTNRYFTPQAQQEAAALGVKLWDRDKLNSMIEKANS